MHRETYRSDSWRAVEMAWRLATVDTMNTSWTRLAALDAVPAGGAKSFGAVTIFRDGDRVHATGSRCPHMGYPMDKGIIRDGVVACAWHQWEFDLGTGGCYRGACDDLPVYPLRIAADGHIEVSMPEPRHDRTRLARALRDALLDGDIYQEAKAIAALLEDGAESREVARIAAEHGFVHSVGAHRSQQAVVELRSIVNAARLAERFQGRDRIGILLQGIRTAGGPAGERPLVSPLPADLDPQRQAGMLERYVADPSPLAIERLLLGWPAGQEGALRALLLDIATAPRFLPERESFIALIDALDACDWLGSEYARHRPALLAWVLGAARGEPEAEERQAVEWLTAREPRLRELAQRADASSTSTVPAEELAVVFTVANVESVFDRILALLERGVTPRSLLDAFSACAARRFDRLRPNNGGMWRSATAGVRLCRAARQAMATPGPHRVRVLFALAWQAFTARWLHPGGAWHDKATAAGSWQAYGEAFKANDLPEARRQAVSACAPERTSTDPAALAGWLEPMVREDLDADQLSTLVAAIAEQRELAEWQTLVTAPIAYAMEGRARQDVLAAARFGRSIMGERQTE